MAGRGVLKRVTGATDHSIFTSQAMRSLANIGTGASELGEALVAWSRAEELADSMDKGAAWHEVWSSLATATEERALKFERSCTVSAASAHLRAADYHRGSEFFIRGLGNEQDPRRQAAVAGLKRNFRRFLQLSDMDFEFFEEELSTGYFIRPRPQAGLSSSETPTIILGSGYDSFAEECFFGGGRAALERGYNVCLIDGPGQGHVVRRVSNPSYLLPELQERHYQAILSLPAVTAGGDVFLFGRSLAGATALKAAAVLPGKLAGLLLDPPQPRLGTIGVGMVSKLDGASPGLLDAFKCGDKAGFDERFNALQKIGESWDKTFWWHSRMGAHSVSSPYDYFHLMKGFDVSPEELEVTCVCAFMCMCMVCVHV